MIELNQGEIKLVLTAPVPGKVSFKELGINEDLVAIDGGFLRIKIDLSGVGAHDYYAVPTIEVSYDENCSETHWQCDFNGETILDKNDHHGHSTILLMNRTKLDSLEHRHVNELIVHAEFPEATNLVTENCFIHLFK